jgi:hypothetical protein
MIQTLSFELLSRVLLLLPFDEALLVYRDLRRLTAEPAAVEGFPVGAGCRFRNEEEVEGAVKEEEAAAEGPPSVAGSFQNEEEVKGAVKEEAAAAEGHVPVAGRFRNQEGDGNQKKNDGRGGRPRRRQEEDQLWKQFYQRMGFSWQDFCLCARPDEAESDSNTWSVLDELLYRRSLLQRILCVDRFQMIPLSSTGWCPVQHEGLAAAAAAVRRQVLQGEYTAGDNIALPAPSSFPTNNGQNNNTYPILRFVARRDLVGSTDYRRRHREGTTSAIFSFDLVSSGVSSQLAVVDIDNRQLLTIARRSMDASTGVMDDVLVRKQSLLVNESSKQQNLITVCSVIQHRSLTMVLVWYVMVGQEHRRELLIYDQVTMGSSRPRRASLRPGLQFVDCFGWDGQLFYICTDHDETTSIDLVGYDDDNDDYSSSTTTKTATKKRADDRSTRHLHHNPFAPLLDDLAVRGLTIRAVAVTNLPGGPVPDSGGRPRLMFLAQSLDDDDDDDDDATSWSDCHVILLDDDNRSAGTVRHRFINLKTAMQEALCQHRGGDSPRSIILLAELLEPSRRPSLAAAVDTDERATAARYCTSDLLVAGDVAVTIHRLESINGNERERRLRQRWREDVGLRVAIWNVGNGNDDWQFLAVINVPLRSHPLLPRFHLDRNRLVIFGSDHIGCIVLIYQIVRPDTENLVAERKTSALQRGRPLANGSGGLHAFFRGDDGMLRVRFVSRIRHPAMDVSTLDAPSLQLACNERFIVVRTCRGNQIDEAAGESDGVLIIDAGPPPEESGRGFMDMIS